MAAAEARAAWQRTANRCFVQEDAKRAPKLACPSAYPSSKQVDVSPANPTDGHENPNVGFMPLDRNSSYYNLSPESRWWLQIQPNYGYQKGIINEQMYTLGAETENCEAEVLNSTFKCNEDPLQNEKCVRKQALKTACHFMSTEEPLTPEMGESFELLEMSSIGCSVSKKVDDLGFDSDSSWIGGGKTEPWWRMTDRDELASLVAQRSLDFIENCDLPQPQNRSVKGDSNAYFGNFDHGENLPSSKDLKAQNDGFSDSYVDVQRNFILGSACRKQLVSCEEQSLFGSDKQSSDDTVLKGIIEAPENDPSKAQLLEALCHSQTRAREAEKAAKQAYAEKEHVLKLFFKQASQLFAYKQWFQLLQLENLYFEIKNTNQPISTLFPVILPWTPYKTRKLPKNPQKPLKGKRSKRSRPSPDISKFAVAFALGLGLVGAGLLLGWTVGWMLPAF